MRLVIFNKVTGEEINPESYYDYMDEGYFIGADGKVYQFDNDGGCGDPECCGGTRYFMTHAKYYDWFVV